MVECDNARLVRNGTGVFAVDLNGRPDMSFTHVNSLSYKGQRITIHHKWRDLYMTLLGKLYVDYPNEIDNVVGKVYGRASSPFVGDCRFISSMRSPGEFAPARYIELNVSATTIISNIKLMLDICSVSYDDVKILYTKEDRKVITPPHTH